MKKLSIITINFNDSKGLQKTIESVINQTYLNYEFIVIDGGSSDDSKSIIEKYQSKITHWVSEKDTGIYNAMNKGILNAQGEYCLFLNSGDYLFNTTVFENVFSKKTDADIIYGNMQIDWGNTNITVGKMPQKMTFEHMYLDTLWHPVSFIKRNLFEKYGMYNEAYKIVADYDFFFKVIIMHSVSMQYIDLVISSYNVNGLSSLAENKILEKNERQKVKQSYLPAAIIEFADKKCSPQQQGNSFLLKLKNLIK